MNDDVQAQKKVLRREFLLRRARISRKERDRVSRKLVRKFLTTDFYRESKIIMAYASMSAELQLTELFEACFADGKTLAIPLIVNKGEMRAVEVPSFDALEPGEFNICTVKPEMRKFVEPEEIDCIIVPGAAFDIHGGRLGLGGGYYDRFLLRAVKAHKIALAYDFQLVDNLPTEFYDVKIDSVMTTQIFWHAVDDQKFREIASP